MKCINELDSLVNDVLRAPNFKLEDLDGFRASTDLARLDAYTNLEHKNTDATFTASAGWMEKSVQIRLPAETTKYSKEEDAPEFVVPGLYHRNITSIMKTVYEEDTFYEMNTTPYKQYVRLGDDPTKTPDRIIDETYSADPQYVYHEEVQKLQEDVRNIARPQDDNLEHVVACAQIWSDSTHLANFGDAALWPGYLGWGNQAKYTSSKPTAFASHHLAYFPKVSSLEHRYCTTLTSIIASRQL